MDAEKLKTVLNLHGKWLREEDGGKRADLTRADLTGADLTGANLTGAYLTGAYLTRADLTRADLTGADLTGAKNIPDYACAVTNILSEGDIIGWKKLRHGKIAKLLIPTNARRSNATWRKCRCDKATVLAVYASDGSEQPSGISCYDESFAYTVGETVTVANFCEDRWSECAAGIHFFITRYEAEHYDA